MATEFQVRCECGGSVAVSEGAAGTRVECPCGRMVAVPSLACLREEAGLPGHRIRARLVIEDMVAQKELPTVTTCGCCGSFTDDIGEVAAECEKAWSDEPGWFTSLFVFLFGGMWAMLLLLQREEREHGGALTLHLPVRMCQGCQRRLRGGFVDTALVVAALALTGAGVAMMLLWTAWGGLLLLGVIVVGAVGRRVRAQRQTHLRSAVSTEPIYKQLLDEYPETTLEFNRTG